MKDLQEWYEDRHNSHKSSISSHAPPGHRNQAPIRKETRVVAGPVPNQNDRTHIQYRNDQSTAPSELHYSPSKDRSASGQRIRKTTSARLGTSSQHRYGIQKHAARTAFGKIYGCGSTESGRRLVDDWILSQAVLRDSKVQSVTSIARGRSMKPLAW